jgi:hypothetical protein
LVRSAVVDAIPEASYATLHGVGHYRQIEAEVAFQDARQRCP